MLLDMAEFKAWMVDKYETIEDQCFHSIPSDCILVIVFSQLTRTQPLSGYSS